ncbi:ROK family transcriptional regulator [Gaoshiqia sediminis]|uniref:ROK family transcriptional regulator n=1 Tax=Gaoshiqia sediminis TaxID=2986998 RepID=A0AA41YD13_9BACT|nr:ROK family transcriptional regulator [Gaoshiqia sediminis]MCW0484285.1 ROK family transcriptional regulator [Gaoshiqia sediminis]
MILHKKEETQKMAISELKRYKLRMQIIRLLYKRKLQSASELSKKINVSLPTVRSILEDLIAKKVAVALGSGNSQGGRKPIIYSLAADAFFILAVELGQYRGKAVIFNTMNEEVSPVRGFDTSIDDPLLEEKLEKIVDQLLTETGLPDIKITAVGISMPGLVDSENGINRTIKRTEDRNIAARLTKRFGIRTYIENDARMQGLGELIFGKARNTNNTLVINWNWGLGLGMVLNGDIYSGATGCAGELSHIRIMENGKLCECGKRGCLQTIAGAQHLLDMAREEIARGTISQLTSQFGERPQELTPVDIINCAKKGDELSISLLTTLSTNLAWGISILIQLYNPELIVLNGPLTQAGQFILIPVRQALNKYCLESTSESVRIEISDMGEHSGLKGVAVMVFKKIFRDKSIEV